MTEAVEKKNHRGKLTWKTSVSNLTYITIRAWLLHKSCPFTSLYHRISLAKRCDADEINAMKEFRIKDDHVYRYRYGAGFFIHNPALTD